MRKNIQHAAFAFLLAIVFQSCYSFTGASIPPHIHTIGIPLAEDISGFGQSEVPQDLTRIITDKFTREGSLQVAGRTNADALLTITISHITDESVGVRTGETLTNKRVSIFIQATYFDQKKQKQFWQRDFQQSADYPIAQNLVGLKAAIASAEDKMSEEILLAVISNW